MDKKDILEQVKKDKVKFISFQFSDVTGKVKSVDAPIAQLEGALDNGIWFDGSSVQGFARIQESDMHLKIDLDTYAVLPWTPDEMKRARVFCDIYTVDDEPFAGDPRGLLKKMVSDLKKKGLIFNCGPEPEFFLFKQNGGMTPVPHDVGGYFDFSSDDEAVQVRTELMYALNSMGLEIEVGHHEVARGQHEIDFRFADALRTADNVMTFKYAVKAIAAQHGLIASFMPKPIFGINGSGMHTHMSLFDTKGNTMFFDKDDELKLSKIAYSFLAGQLKHARGLSALVAPTVNSYKRLVPGYEAPVYVCWAQMNRSALVRIPRYTAGQEKATRIELRCPDPSCNPYLAFAGMLAAGKDGMENELEPPKPLNNVNIYKLSVEERKAKGIKALPSSLADALSELDNNTLLKDALGEEIYSAFRRAKLEENENYRIHVTDWEVEKYMMGA
jgi:glutamine synthetase